MYLVSVESSQKQVYPPNARRTRANSAACGSAGIKPARPYIKITSATRAGSRNNVAACIAEISPAA